VDFSGGVVSLFHYQLVASPGNSGENGLAVFGTVGGFESRAPIPFWSVAVVPLTLCNS